MLELLLLLFFIYLFIFVIQYLTEKIKGVGLGNFAQLC